MAMPRYPCLLLAALLTSTCMAAELGFPEPALAPAPPSTKEGPTPAPPPAPPTPPPVPLHRVPAAASVEGPDGEFKIPTSDHLPMRNALQALKDDMWALIKTEHYQWAVATAAFALGFVALHDGRRSFRMLVLISIVTVFFLSTLSQLRSTWTGKLASKLEYVVSLEVGLFFGLAAHKGWEGMQLLLGLILGVYMFHMVQGLAENFGLDATHSAFKTIVCTLLVLFGSWMLDETRGAGRVLGVLAPLFASSLVVAACGFFSMYLLSVPDVAKGFHIVVSPTDVPSVFEYWYMIVDPLHSKAVGYFQASQTSFVMGTQKLEMDRILAVFFTAVIALLGVRSQMRKLSAESALSEKSGLKVRLLTKKV